MYVTQKCMWPQSQREPGSNSNERQFPNPQFSITGVTLSDGFGGARGVIVIVAGYGHGDTSLNPGPDWLHFT